MVSRFRRFQRRSRQVWQGKSLSFQDSKRQTLTDVTTQGWHQIPSQGVVQIVVKSPGIRLRQSQASSQVCQSDKRLHLHHGASSSSPKRHAQGLIPVEIISYSDSDWAGCQKSRRSTSGSLIRLLSVNIASTSRTEASVSHSSAEAGLYAMTQATVESLAIKHFPQELKSAILATVKTDSSAGGTMASRLGIQGSQSTLSSSIYGFRMFSAKESSH